MTPFILKHKARFETPPNQGYEGLGFRRFPKIGVTFWGSHNKDYGILGVYIGTCEGKLPDGSSPCFSIGVEGETLNPDVVVPCVLHSTRGLNTQCTTGLDPHPPHSDHAV